MWENIDKSRPDSAHYSVMRKIKSFTGMEALRDMFREGKADELNFVLFSTSGVHGTYTTIEEAERAIHGDEDASNEVTILIVHPRLVSLRYGTCKPENEEDIEFLKALRESSSSVVRCIGWPDKR